MVPITYAVGTWVTQASNVQFRFVTRVTEVDLERGLRLLDGRCAMVRLEGIEQSWAAHFLRPATWSEVANRPRG
jgi:hypothetical protein